MARPWDTDERARMSAVTLHSPLSRAQCVERLRDAADPWWKPFKKKRASGAVGTQRFWLMKRIGYNNSWQTIMQGRFEDDAQGTRIACRFGLSVFTFVLQVVLFGFAGAVLAVWIVAGPVR